MDFLRACQKLISIDSSPSQGTVEAVRFLKELAESMGFEAKIMEEVVSGVNQANIFVYPSKNPQNLLLQTHLDTVDPGSFALWSKTGFNPYQASIRGTKLYGLGAADVKLDFLCKLYSLVKTDWSKKSKSAVLLGTFGEEQKMRGALKAVLEESVQAKYALIGEPTDLNVVYAGKGIARIEIVIPFAPGEIDFFAEEEVTSSTQSKLFQGKPAHSSNPSEGENAVEKMLDYLDQMPDNIKLINVDGGTTFNTIPTQAELEFDLSAATPDPRPQKLRTIYRKIKALEEEFKKHPNNDFDPPTPTINMGKIRTTHDHIQIIGVVRWSSHISDREYISWMKQLAKVCKEQAAVFRTLDVKRPFITSTQGEFARSCLQIAKEIYPEAVFKTQPVTNEANVFHQHGFECIVFGPGHRPGNTHTPEEHVEIEDLHKAQEFYYKITEQVCS